MTGFTKSPNVTAPLIIKAIEGARSLSGVGKDKVSDEVLFSLIAIESGGNPQAWDKNRTNKKGETVTSQFVGLLQQGNAVTKDLFKLVYKRSIPVEKFQDKTGQVIDSLAAYVYGDAQLAITEFLTFMNHYEDRHEWDPDRIAICWKAGVGAGRAFGQKLKTIGPGAAMNYLATLPNKEAVYLRRFRGFMKVYGGKLKNNGITDAMVQEASEKVSARTLEGIEGGAPISMTPFELASYITPEELRKGIIAQIFYMNEWHLAQLADPENQKNVKNETNYTPVDESALTDASQASADAPNQSKMPQGSARGDLVAGDEDINSRRRAYVKSIIEAEFYRRRMAARSIPAITGPFNPYPVSGFPGLILTAGRPILGYVTSVTHTIHVAGASGTTGVSMDSPRYWDEGEIWYWLGGDFRAGDDAVLWRRFPHWHNRNVVPYNNYVLTEGGKRYRKSPLDRFYNFMLGCDGIEYRSNHMGRVDSAEKIRKALKERQVFDLDVNPETLEILEYNAAIAQTDKEGRFAPGTLAHRFYGHIKPYENAHTSLNPEDQMAYNERYGVFEYELLAEFLGNRFRREKNSGTIFLSGPTYKNEEKDGKIYPNAIQKQVMKYIDSLKARNLSNTI